MKLLPVVWVAIWRNRAESLLTFLALCVGFTLFGVMVALNAAFGRAIDATRMDRLIVSCAFDCGVMPAGYRDQITRTPGVIAVGGALPLGGTEQDRRHDIAVTFMDEGMRAAWPELPMSARDWRALDIFPTGVFLTRQAAARRNVRKGDVLIMNTLPGSRGDGGGTWPFTVLGFIDDPPGWRQSWDSDLIIGNMRYQRDTGRPDEKAIVRTFYVAIDSPAHAAAVCHEIQRWFTNATPAVTCVPAKQNSIQQQQANINLRQISLGIGAAGLFMILFVCANGIAESVRERLSQFGILKAIGFGTGTLARLVIIEAAIPTLMAALVGSAVAPAVGQLLSSLAAKGLIDIPIMPVSSLALVWALPVALLVALVSAVAPLHRLLRTDVVSMMSKR